MLANINVLAGEYHNNVLLRLSSILFYHLGLHIFIFMRMSQNWNMTLKVHSPHTLAWPISKIQVITNMCLSFRQKLTEKIDESLKFLASLSSFNNCIVLLRNANIMEDAACHDCVFNTSGLLINFRSQYSPPTL